MDSIPRIIEGRKRKKGQQGLLSEDLFRALVLYECARCDRNSHHFSLIQLELQDSVQKKRRVNELVRRVLKRIREIDEAGWLNDNSLGIFLPETGREGARKLAEDVSAGFSYQIYTYPWLPSGLPKDGSEHGLTREKRPSDTLRPAERMNPADSVEGTSNKSQILFYKQFKELFLPGVLPFWKRTFDIVGATILLSLLSPVLLLVTLYIKLVSPGPVFFRQERIGYLGKPFIILKFRTMVTEKDNITIHKNYLKNLINNDSKEMTKLDTGKDDRLIPLAGLLRQSCIDELPQLFNVLKGEMSLVGPRPCLAYEAEEFKLWQYRRFQAFPGLTGLWQVSGKNRLTFREMMRLDVRYAICTNPAKDILISIKTIPAIVDQFGDTLKKKLFSLVRISSPLRKIRKIWAFFL